MMGIGVANLRWHLRKATKEGWLRFDDPLERLEHELIPQTMDNLKHFLDKKDRQTTIETAKNTIFKVYQESQGVGQTQQTVLALKIDMQAIPNQETTKIISGEVVGTPKELKD